LCYYKSLSLSFSLSLNIFLFYQAQGLEAQPSSFSTGPKDLQEERKYVDDVQVNVEGSKDVFLWTHGIATITHQELGIEGQELRREKQTWTVINNAIFRCQRTWKGKIVRLLVPQSQIP